MAKKIKTLEELLEEALVPEDEVPYKVPENWVWSKLGEVAKWGSGGTPSRKKPEYYTGDIPWIKTGELNDSIVYDTEEKITEEAVGKSSAKIFPKGSVVIAMYGATIGKTGILGVDATTNQACAVAIPNSKIFNNLYLFNYLKSQKENFICIGKGGAQPNISQTIIKEYFMPVPPLSEQKRIVQKIEILFSKLDKSKELIEEAREDFENRKSAILAKAFRGELTKKWREENADLESVEELLKTIEEDIDKSKSKKKKTNVIEDIEPPYELPEKWKWVKLEDIVNVKGGKRLPKGESLVNYDTGHPYIKAGDLKKGTVLFDNLQYITEEICSKIKNYTVNSGDVYITIVGACIGDVGIIPNELDGANLTENAAKLCNIIYMNNVYIAKWLSSYEAQHKIKDKISSATLGKLSLTRIKTLEIPLPPLEEQKQIVKILDKLLEEESKIEELTQLKEQIEFIKKSILAKAFRGDLGTNDPSEESALELLKDILKEKL